MWGSEAAAACQLVMTGDSDRAPVRTSVPQSFLHAATDAADREEDTMPRYLVERSFPDGLAIPIDEGGAKACQVVVDGNATEGVTWIHSYVTPDKRTTYCIYDGPSPEAIRP